MTKAKASRPTKVRKKPLPKVSKPEPLFAENDIAKPTPIVGKPSIGVAPNYVETVGLGNLKVTTIQGVKDDGNT